jgi:alpha-D-xyloside xylohydrolase
LSDTASFLRTDGTERLRVADAPTEVRMYDGDVLIKLSFREYSFSNTAGNVCLSRNEQAAPVVHALRVSAYGRDCLRIVLLPNGQVEEASTILCSETLPSKIELSVVEAESGYEIVDVDNRIRGRINCGPIATRHWSDLLPAREKSFEVEWFPDGEIGVPFKSYDMFAHGVTDSLPLAYVEKEGAVTRTLFSLEASGNECFAGTGERFAKMDLSGRTITLENADGLGVNSARTYKNVPFYMSSRPYGLFVHTSAKTQLSFADISTRSAQGMVEEDRLDLFLIGGGNLQNVLRNYCSLTGFSPEVPLWSYGIWMSRMSYFSPDEITTVARRLREEEFPCDVLHIDTGWFKEDWVCDWKFCQEKFPNPEQYISELREAGYRITLWQTPDISRKSDVAAHAEEMGYLPSVDATAEAGSDFSMQDICGPIDFSNPDACNWYKNDLLKPLLQMGVAAIKTDFGENIPMQASYHSLPASLLRNRYALLYQKAAFEISEELYGEGNALVWARAGWAGCQRYPVHWGGDAESSWEGMAGSLKGGLHLGLSGFSYWSHDVPGFHGSPDFMNSWPSDELYVRWTQFGVFSSHFRYHGTSPREPYEYPNVSDTVRSWWKLRYALIPYIVEQAEIASKTGMPLLRALILEDEEDPTCWHIDDQYMFGEEFMVAPVMSDDGIRDIYLPAGEWVDFWTGESLAGQRWLRDVNSQLSRMPVYVRQGATIPIYSEKVACTDEMKPEHIEKVTIREGFRGIPVCSELWMN